MRVLLQRIGKCGVGRDVGCAADSPGPKFRWSVVASEGPCFQVSRGAEQCDLAAFELEGHVLQRDEMLAGLGAGIVEIVDCCGACVHASADRGDTLESYFVFEFGHVAGGLQLSERALQAESLFRDLVAGGFGLLLSFLRVSVGHLGVGSLR
jgi:hypothetical protein